MMLLKPRSELRKRSPTCGRHGRTCNTVTTVIGAQPIGSPWLGLSVRKLIEKHDMDMQMMRDFHAKMQG